MAKKKTPLQAKDTALWLSVWAMGSAVMLTSCVERQKCQCGEPPNTDGVPCNACAAIQVTSVLMEAIEKAEKAFTLDKKKSNQRNVVKRKRHA